MTKIIAHRGSSGKYPENTMLAFEMAVKEGADGIETDVRKTKDGVIVIMHDNSLARLSDDPRAELKVTESNYDDFKDIDISSKKFPDAPIQYVPKLTELLELVKNTGILLNIEIKPNNSVDDGLEYDVMELVERYGVKDKVFYSCFDHVVIANIIKKDPTAKVAPLYGNAVFNVWDYCKSFGAFAVHPEFKNHILRGNSKACLDAGLEINAWTVNHAEDAVALVKNGVTGLITNFPKEIREAINE